MFVKPQEVKDTEAVILDIRTKAEHDNMRLMADHTFLPLDEIEIAKFAQEQNKQLLILCHSGGRAKMLCEMLIEAGLENTKVIEGGISSCKKCMQTTGTDIMEDAEVHSLAQQSFQLFLYRNR